MEFDGMCITTITTSRFLGQRPAQASYIDSWMPSPESWTTVRTYVRTYEEKGKRPFSGDCYNLRKTEKITARAMHITI